MAQQILKIDEWQGASKYWYVADVHTWTGWREMAEVLGVEGGVNSFKEYLHTKYKAVTDVYIEEQDFLLFYWPMDDYKNAHQFKLDVNRIARNKKYMVEKK